MPLAIFEHRFCTPCGVRKGTQEFDRNNTNGRYMHAISKYNKLNNLSCVSNCKAPQDRQKTGILAESAPQGRRKPISRPRMGVGSMVGGVGKGSGV